MKYRISLIILLLLSSFALNALTLEEAVNYASENSVPVKISYETVKISNLEKKQAISNFLPSLSLNTTYTRLDEAPSMTIAGPM
ncbi:TolC family protein, partial [candidate division WOR-3 bacterium]|nr:TolC family protein [candidate division WOR-3 bacterium]